MDKIAVFAKETRETENIEVRDFNQFENKLIHFYWAGAENVKIVIDFDHTVTRKHHETGEVPNSFDLFTRCASIPSSVKDALGILYREYSGYQYDDHIPKAIRLEKLDEWCEKCDNLFRSLEFNTDDIKTITENSMKYLRLNTDAFFQKVEEQKIPTFILSAGQGDCIEFILKKGNINIRRPVVIVSNFLQFGRNILNGFAIPMVHALNKETCLKSNTFYKQFANRQNIILIGDSLSDADVITDDSATILKIGFLNKNDPKLLEQYRNVFDVVLIEDESLDFIIKLIEIIHCQDHKDFIRHAY